MKSLWNKIKEYPAFILFFLFLFGFMAVDMLYPDRAQSELENTKLKQKPQFSFSSLMKNKWTADYGEYVKDQVAFRDNWIDLQSRSEMILMQKAENGDMLLGKDHMLFKKMFSLTDSEIKQLPKNINALSEFAQRHGDKVTVMIAPSASVIYPEKLPFHAPMVNENAMLDEIFTPIADGTEAHVIDLREPFREHKDEYLYYRNDHHWTSHGAYLAYLEFCEQKGLTPFDVNAHEAVIVPDFYGTSYAAARNWNAVPDEITYYPLPNQQTIWNVIGENDFEVQSVGDLYDYDKFNVYDKYAAFLHGNPGYSTIEGDGEGSILVVKDSYANCFIPYLTANYAKIGVIDMRFFGYGIDSLMEHEGYDEALILYNFQSFKADAKLANLNRNPIEK